MTTLPLPGLPIKALSLWQPWASLMAAGVKIDDIRDWTTTYRGPLAIHAAKTIDRVGAPAHLCASTLGMRWWCECPAGAIVAIGMLTDCRPSAVARRTTTAINLACGDFTTGRHALRVERIRPLIEPIPVTGRRLLFNWVPPTDIEDNLGPVIEHMTALRHHGLLRWAA